MPSQATADQIRLNSIATCFTATANTLDILAASIKAPFMWALSETTQSLSKNIETVKQNRSDYAELMEQTHGVLNAIIMVHVKSDTRGELPTQMLKTLHKIHTFVETLQKGSKVKKFFRQGELSALLKECKAGLEQACNFFEIHKVNFITDIVKIQQDAEQKHNKIQAVLTADPWYKNNKQAVFRISHKVEWGKPVLLGQFFIMQKSQHTELATVIRAHLGLKPGRDLSQAVVKFLSTASPTLLILDNLETVWEPIELCDDIEEFLSLLTDLKDLALIITMRGAERPAKVQWSHPFLVPLQPLKHQAAQQTFIDIAEDHHNPKDIDQVLSLTDNMPLAITLIAHLVDVEGCSSVLSRWEVESTTMISEGYDRKSSLDASISISLSSSRMEAVPHAQELLSLLSMLPDGLSDVELLQSKLPIEDIWNCKTTLIRTALAYLDHKKRLKALVPIREYMQKIHPPSNELFKSLLKHYHELLELHKDFSGTEMISSTVRQISSNLANIQSLLRNGLQKDHPDLTENVFGALYLNSFSRITGRGHWHLGDYLTARQHAYEAQSEARALHWEVMAWTQLGNYKESIPLCYRARELLVLCGMAGGALDHEIMNQQAEIHLAKSEYREAHNIQTQIPQNFALDMDPYHHAFASLNLAEIMQPYIESAKKVFLTMEQIVEITMCDIVLADLHLVEGESSTAQALFTTCLRASNHPAIRSHCLERLGNTGHWGAFVEMFSWTTVYLAHSIIFKECLGINKALQFLGDIFLAQADEDTAISLFSVALEGFTYMDVHHSKAECMLRLGDISRGYGNLLKAVELWDKARPLYERSSQTRQTEAIDERIASLGQDVLEKHRSNSVCLVEINVPMVEEAEEDLSDEENLHGVQSPVML
ncbi:hypothetical protein DFH08DRAFT_818350 [Mycena albidolilacea]|uniref:Uncharacterized protein n=1 Tax=Mycena albidolilacea TaxID=1033008 RepID=A0AAD6ZGN9_9AGAR|nr:hypothetical protein DFH08DRAFT_818350 [Mycena albidolilacea]